MGIFISVPKTVECVTVAVLFSLLLCGCSYRLLGILQSTGYRGAKMAGWLKKKGNHTLGRHGLLAALCVLSTAILSLCFAFTGEWAAVIGLAAYAVLFLVFIWADNKVALRTPLTVTPRLKRLYAVLFLVTAILVYFAVVLLNFADALWENLIFNLLRYTPLAVFALLLVPLVLLSNLISKVYETPHNRKFIKKARAKLAASHIRVIGITGSYGKTSTKKILTDILSEKYRVLSTPRSHNTPLGIALAVNGASLDEYDIFIAEMGARHVGDIDELCAICPPDYSLITGICPQHLESFGSEENIVRAKAEILSHTKEGAVIAADCFGLFEAYSCAKEKEDCVSEIVGDGTGTSFTLSFGGRSKRVKTKLLGEHAAHNVGLAAQLAFRLGMSLDEIAERVEKLDYIEHRLQLIQNNGVNILDDGYNSNVKGAAAALEVLKSFGGRKIVVTPGLVELGILEVEENKELGRKLVGFDLVILVGDTLIGPVKEGYLEEGGDGDRLKIRPNLSAAQEELKAYIGQGDTVLFLNDLPDIY